MNTNDKSSVAGNLKPFKFSRKQEKLIFFFKLRLIEEIAEKKMFECSDEILADTIREQLNIKIFAR